MGDFISTTCDQISNFEIDGNCFSSSEYSGSIDGGILFSDDGLDTQRYYGGIDVADNEFGLNLTTEWEFNYGNECGSGPGLTKSGSSFTSTNCVSGFSDPGIWEYIPPTISSATGTGTTLSIISATDGDSGLGSTARWPFSLAAQIQADDGSNNYSEVIDYSATPNYDFAGLLGLRRIRVADVDHNWSSLFTLSHHNPCLYGTYTLENAEIH